MKLEPSPTMHPSIQKLHALQNRLQGNNLAQMTPYAIAALRTAATKDFIEATAGLNTLLLGANSDSPRWLWQAKEAEHFGGNWIATFSVIDTGQMESAIGKHESVQMAAARFPCLKLTVDLFAEYHHPGGTGLQVAPRVTISLRSSGDPEFVFVEEYLALSKNHFPTHGNGTSVEIIPVENCCDSIVNPVDVEKAFSQIASAARSAALQKHDDTRMTEAIEFVLTFDLPIDQRKMEEAFEYMGQMFTCVMVSQK